ncbi:MAG: hypothetical protein ACJA0U_002229 [Salibacteraceae bacterium]|jgi:hypothetical protein
MTVISSLTLKIDSLYKNTSIAPLIIFRIIFGALMLFGISRFLYKGWVQQLYIDPQYHFGYYGFEWVKPLEGSLMYIPFVLMIVASIFIIVGFLYRYSAFVFFICFTYIELLDKSNYLNHYYFVSLMSFLMVLVPANRYFSIDAMLWIRIKQTTTQQWHIGILKFQLAVVYIFAGIAKLNSDWLLDAQPLKTWLQAHHNIPVVGGLLQEEWVAYVFSWFGCGYDLFIVFFLLGSKYRKYAYVFVVVFHFITWYLFPIGVFPWVMIFSTIIFFSIEFHERVLNWFLKVFKQSALVVEDVKSIDKRKLTLYFVSLYVVVQLLVPFRYVLYSGGLFWNEEGYRFSWRVMLMHKEGYATFYLVDPKTGRESEINNAEFLTRTQEDQMATQPDMILQYAQILKKYYNGKTLHYGDYVFNIKNPEIHAEIYVSLNGRRSQLFVDKKHDLASLSYNLKHRDWIEPFKK